MLLQINAAAQCRPRTTATNIIQQRINTLNERLTNNEYWNYYFTFFLYYLIITYV
jgi:hypothetical protein